MKSYNIYILAVSILLIITAISSLTIKSNIPIVRKISLNHITEENVLLDLTEDKGDEYINKIYFVGDSTTYHFIKGGIDESHILVPSSYTLTLNSNITNVKVGNQGLTIANAIRKAECEIVIITIGVNGADNFTETQYKSYYKKLIHEIQLESPSTKIILQSVFPVTKDYSDYPNGVSNDGIDRLNEWAKEIAFEEELYYLDTQSILKGENGAQLECYSVKDGVHMNSEAYDAIINYIRTHAIE